MPRPFPKYDDPKPYLPNDVPKIFPNRLFPPALRQESHPLSLDVIIAISQTEQDTPHDSPFRHDIHPDEVAVANAEFNSRLIDEYDMDMQRLLDAYPYSVISPGSEFRPAGVLEPLLAGHPYWPRLKSIISHGVSYPLTAVEDETARRAENDAILEYGNHASGKKNPEALTKVLLKDASRGYSLPITFSCAKSIKHSRISPMGVAHQLGIDAHGDLIPKDRLTHDQSFSLGFCPSTNDLIDQEQLIDLVMGHCIDRIIHQIVVLRWHHPTEKILLSKFDWASAYRRIHGDGEVAARNITIDPSNLFAHLNLRLTFGASANPAEFSVVSEIGTDLCNDLADLQEWTPDCCVSPLQSGIGPPQFLSEDIPIAQAQELAVMVPPHPHGFHDCYLDDMIQLFLATEENIHRCPCIVPLIVHLMTRPLADDEPITRKAMLEDDKLKAEGAPVEEQRVLGWTIDTRRLLLRLPYEKKVGWTKQVQELLDKRKTTRQSQHPRRRARGRLVDGVTMLNRQNSCHNLGSGGDSNDNHTNRRHTRASLKRQNSSQSLGGGGGGEEDNSKPLNLRQTRAFLTRQNSSQSLGGGKDDDDDSKASSSRHDKNSSQNGGISLPRQSSFRLMRHHRSQSTRSLRGHRQHSERSMRAAKTSKISKDETSKGGRDVSESLDDDGSGELHEAKSSTEKRSHHKDSHHKRDGEQHSHRHHKKKHDDGDSHHHSHHHSSKKSREHEKEKNTAGSLEQAMVAMEEAKQRYQQAKKHLNVPKTSSSHNDLSTASEFPVVQTTEVPVVKTS